MILNISSNDPKIKRRIEEAIGRPYSFFKSLKLGGTGSQRLLIEESSPELNSLLVLDNNPNNCNIEIRPKGIIVHFRSRLETYGWIIKHTDLTIENELQRWNIRDSDNYMLVTGANNRLLDHHFLQRLKDVI